MGPLAIRCSTGPIASDMVRRMDVNLCSGILSRQGSGLSGLAGYTAHQEAPAPTTQLEAQHACSSPTLWPQPLRAPTCTAVVSRPYSEWVQGQWSAIASCPKPSVGPHLPGSPHPDPTEMVPAHPSDLWGGYLLPARGDFQTTHSEQPALPDHPQVPHRTPSFLPVLIPGHTEPRNSLPIKQATGGQG